METKYIEFIKENINRPRLGVYFVHSIDPNVRDCYQWILEKTAFLDERFPKEKKFNVPVKLRLWHILNNDYTIPVCRICNENTCTYNRKNPIELDGEAYSRYCSAKCHRNDPFNEKNSKATPEDWAKLNDPDWLYDQHITQNKPIDRIAREHTFSAPLVEARLKKFGIERIVHNYISDELKSKLQSYEFWEQEYLNTDLSLRELAKKLGISMSTLWAIKTEAGIPNKGQIPNDIKELLSDKEWLEEQMKTKSFIGIASELGVTDCTVGRYAEMHGLRPDNYISQSQAEREIVNYIRSFGIEVEENIEGMLDTRHELDIVVPSKNISFEFNGMYWHSHKFRDSDYHLKKTMACKEKGINLYHIWEHDWTERKDIVLSMIKSKLGLNEKIFARKCILKKIENKKVIDNFLIKNHLQGKSNNYLVAYGLFYNEELVSIMTFKKSWSSLGYDYELSRFCSKVNINVVGAASRLLKAFRKEYEGSIISYARIDYSDGNLYKKLGFKCIKQNKPQHFSVLGRTVYERFETRHDKLKDLLLNYDPDKSEIENLKDNGFLIVHRCGTYTFILE